jgi:hypothetical protein
MKRCYGTYKSLFCTDQKGCFCKIFNNSVEETRADEIIKAYKQKLNGWSPRWTNRIKLYEASGKAWKWEDSQAQARDEAHAWDDMPQAAIDYLKSLPEFDLAIFKEITGLDFAVKEPSLSGAEVEVVVNGKKYCAVIK